MKRLLFQKWLTLLLCMCTGISTTLQAQFLNPDRRTLENNKICNDPIVGTGVTSPATPSGLSVCILCGAGGGAVVDGNISNFGNVTLLDVNALGAALVVVRDGLQYYPAGNRVGFVVRSTLSLLQADVLSGLEIQTYRNGTLVNTANTSGGISLGVIGGSSGKQIISFITTADFDEVRLVSRGLANAAALGGLAVYYAFEEPASCQVDCTKPIVNNGTPATNYASGAVPSSDIILCRDADNEANLIDSDLNNYGQLGVLASTLGCYASFEVTAAQDYPAGTEAGFVISGVSLLNLLPVGLLSNITVQTLNSSGGVVETSTPSSLVAVNLLGTNSKTKVGFVTGAAFRKIKIIFGGLLSTLRVYYPYVVEDSDADGIPDCRDGCASTSFTDTDGDGLFDPCDANTANLTVTNTSSPASPVTQNTNVTFTTTVTETGANSTTGVIVTEVLSPGLTYVSHTAPPGTNYDPATGIWTIGSALLGDVSSLNLVIVATVTQPGISTNTATISLPAGQTNTSPNTSASACVSVPYQICEGQTQTLTATTSAPYQWYKNGIAIMGATNSTYGATTSGTYSTNPTCTTGNCCYYVNVNTSPVATVAAAPGAGAGNAACLPLSGAYPVSLTLGNCAGGTFTVYQTKNGTETTLVTGIGASPYNFNLTASATGNTTDTYTFKATCTVSGCEGVKSTASSAITITTQPAAPATPVASAGVGAGTPSCLPINGTYPVSLILGTCAGGTFTVFQTKNGTKTTLATSVAASPYNFNLTASASSNTTDTYTFSASCTISGCTSAESVASNSIILKTQPAAPPAPTATTILSIGDLLCLNLGAIVPVTVNVLGSCPGGTISLYRTKNSVVTEQLTFIPGLPLLDNLTASSSTDVYVYSAVCTVNGCSSPQSPLTANLTLSTNCNGADLQISNSVLPSNPSLNQNVTFTTTVTEIGTGNFTNVAVTETFTNGLIYVSHVAPAGTSYDPVTGIWTIGNALTPAEISSLTLSIVMTVANPGVSTNTATLTSGDNTPGNNSSTVCVSVPYQICTGGSVVLTAQTAGQWYRNGVLLFGETGTTYTATQGGAYTNTSLLQALNCTNNCCFVVTEIQTTAPTVTAGPATGNTTNASCMPVNTPYPVSIALGNCVGGTFTIYQSKNSGAETTLATGVTTTPYNLTLTSSATPGTTDTYVYSATCSASGCTSSRSSSSTVTLTTQPAAPNAPTVVALNLNIDQLLCLNLGAVVPVTITPNGSCPGGALTLFRTQNGVRTQVQLLLGVGSELLTLNSTTDVFAYSVVCTINGCSSPDSPTATVTLSTKPPTPTFTNTAAPVCANSMVAITVNNCPSGTVTWTTSTGTQTTTAPNHTITVQAPASGSTNITAVCTVGVGIGCQSDPGTYVLSVLAPPTITVNTNGNSTIVCQATNTATYTVNFVLSGCSGTYNVFQTKVTNGGAPVKTALGSVISATLTSSATPNTTDVFTFTASCTTTSPVCTTPESAATSPITINTNSPTPIFANSSEPVCKNSTVTVTVSNCPGTVSWSTGATTSAPNNFITITAPNGGNLTVTATCTVSSAGSCPSSPVTLTLGTKAFDVIIIDVGQSQSKKKPGSALPISAWAPFVTPSPSGPSLVQSTQANPAIILTDNYPAPRFWTVFTESCNPTPSESIQYNLLCTLESSGQQQSFNTHENNLPYLMFANGDMFTELFTINNPFYGFYFEVAGQNIYDSGFPKGSYKMGIRSFDAKGIGASPTVRTAQGNEVDYQEFWFKIQSSAGPGLPPARIGVQQEAEFATVAPNPVNRTLTTVINGAKGQIVKLNLTDATGRLLLQREVTPASDSHREEVDMMNHTTGMYFMQVVSPTKKAVLKVIKATND